MDEHPRRDCAAAVDRARLDRGPARNGRTPRLHVPSALVDHGARAVRRGLDRDARRLASPIGGYFFVASSALYFLAGSATTMATASPFGETARRVILPN